MNFLPWQIDHAKRLLSQPEQLPHALLIYGLAGVGQREFALAMAASLLCEAPQAQLACGQCQACQWIRAGNHPDLRLIRPEAVAVREGAQDVLDEVSASSATKKPSEDIKIDQIRALESWYHRATHRGAWRIVVLYPADALSVVSASALLKALEEPPNQTLFLLTSDAPDRLLPTIVSRCQKLPLHQPEPEACSQWLSEQGVAQPEQWLAAAGGAPLAALQMSQTLESPCPPWALSLVKALSTKAAVDLASMADDLAKSPAAHWIPVLQKLSTDACLACVGLSARYFPALAGQWPSIALREKLPQAQEMAQWMTQQARLAHHPLSPKLFAQVCLQRFHDALI
jgi:DNA polymerase-3 subunit delta'